ncbi:MAG: DUF3419 family protein [Chitinophagales bacterium]|nr:DUF3419 family protein [Chitinophagales bacterium]
MKKLTETVDFNFVRYANCWEDADVLLKGLAPAAGGKILSIGSAGDNSFSLLGTAPELLVAIDLNPAQLHLIELKKVAIQRLEYEELLAFLGFHNDQKRRQTFDLLKNELSRDARVWWEMQTAQIEKGVILQGKFERYFRYFSKKILPWIHRKKTTQALLAPKNAAAQADFYSAHWNTWRWRLLFKIFFSKYVMGKYGRDPEFLKQVEVSVGEYIFQKAETHLKSVAAQQNFILHFNLCGHFGPHLPDYLQLTHFPKIKENLAQLHIASGYAEQACKQYGQFDSMNLSNIFEYMDSSTFGRTAAELCCGLNTGGRMAYWNLMVPRRVSEIYPERVAFLESQSIALSAADRGFFYNRFLIDQKI